MAVVATGVSQRVQEFMRKGIANLDRLEAHLKGDPKRGIPPCAQCAEADANPRRVRAWCEYGRDTFGLIQEAAGASWMQISQARTRAGRPPRLLPGPFSMRNEIHAFYDWEFDGPLTPRQRERRRDLTRIGDVFHMIEPDAPRPPRFSRSQEPTRRPGRR